MKLLNKFETVKLHYGKYLYKLQIFNPLSPIFRTEFQNGKYNARIKLDEYKSIIDSGEMITVSRWRYEEPVSDNYYFEAEHIYKFIQKAEDLKIRIEGMGSMILYSNSKDELLDLSKSIKMHSVNFWEPSPEYADIISSNSKIVVLDNPSEWKYKIYFRCSMKNRIDSKFADWIKNNLDKVKIGPVTLEGIENSGYLNDHYFYIKNDKVLSLIQLMIGHNIRRVEKRVYKGDLDKYNYAE